jgi:hypothetical protein
MLLGCFARWALQGSLSPGSICSPEPGHGSTNLPPPSPFSAGGIIQHQLPQVLSEVCETIVTNLV